MTKLFLSALMLLFTLAIPAYGQSIKKGPGNAVTVFHKDGTSQTIGEYRESSLSTTYTFNGSGGTTSAVTVYVTKIGRVVTLWSVTMTTTSGTGSTVLSSNTALPSWAWPTSISYGFASIRQNSVALASPGLVSVSPTGIISFNKDATGAAWTNSVSGSGLDAPWSVTYTKY